MKRYTFTIPQDIGEERLLNFAQRRLPQLPPHALREAFDRRDVKQNGSRMDRRALALPGATVEIYVAERVKPREIAVLYQDENVLVIVKPAGVSCEADAHGGLPLPALLQQQLGYEPLLCHRLDNPTEGLMVLARNAQALAELERAFREREIIKGYTCLVRGTPRPKHAVLKAYLLKDAKAARVSVTASPRAGSVPIVTEYTVVSPGACSRLEIRLHTGRTHQIRAHMAFAGHPLLGDDQYGDRAFNRQYHARRLMLCATTLCLRLQGLLAYLDNKTFSHIPAFMQEIESCIPKKSG